MTPQVSTRLSREDRRTRKQRMFGAMIGRVCELDRWIKDIDDDEDCGSEFTLQYAPDGTPFLETSDLPAAESEIPRHELNLSDHTYEYRSAKREEKWRARYFDPQPQRSEWGWISGIVCTIFGSDANPEEIVEGLIQERMRATDESREHATPVVIDELCGMARFIKASER